ncbi:thioredoxin family protein [uncultured Desulfovibrio sp.]|nr:thioredoxin family protein [uncultured Desulfovibrio sp.]
MRGEPKEMMLLVIMSTPAVVIDGRVMCAERVPSGQEVREWIAGGADGGR